MIGFKSGVIIGLGVGYVFGARAGRERYLQIMEAWTNVRGDERVGAVVDKAAGIMAAPSEQVREMIGDGLRSVSDAVESVTDAVDPDTAVDADPDTATS
ncbi:MAG: YtxH domain-containing protein [Acidimicrobiia bacterium]